MEVVCVAVVENDYSGASTSSNYEYDAFVAAVDNDKVIIMNAMLTLLAKHSVLVLTCFYHSHIRKNAPPPGHVFEPTGTIFELFHEDGAINVASRMLKRHIKKKAQPPGAHVFQLTGYLCYKSGEQYR
ncbi:hypothetical protein DPMN_139604 [Dreissena polymorpha]|uniref:Uncharacterized protein n=1 Tax=Dreissena polymorpha TaxID=45954 RepID=A0A9D4G9F1_DREPO|nr:hypothetical protein DPMN_139604 [Dreissena polymorpha]